MAAQAQRVRRIAARGEPWQEIRLPAPRVAISAVHEEQRRSGVGSLGQPRTDFEIRLGWQHGVRDDFLCDLGDSGSLIGKSSLTLLSAKITRAILHDSQ